jgi:hypothetical protein
MTTRQIGRTTLKSTIEVLVWFIAAVLWNVWFIDRLLQ